MTKPPKRSRPKLVISNGDDEIVQPPPELEEEELPPRQALFRAAWVAACAQSGVIGPNEAFEAKTAAAALHHEVHIIISEQWLSPHERATARWRRKANESLCQAIETDPSFREAWERLKA